MILDGHLHMMNFDGSPEEMLSDMQSANVDGGLLMSVPPPGFTISPGPSTSKERLDRLMEWASASDKLYPVYFIDPLENDAQEQVAQAIDRGVIGFKVICNRYYPGDPRAQKVFGAIAATGRPVLVHSGILWDGIDSGRYNRPVEFESLIEIPGLRFALAHIAWPWCDELIAVYGKFLNAYAIRPDISAEMFIDITPGTPPSYREDSLRKLFATGYDVANNVLWGTDGIAANYNVEWARQWIARDTEIFNALGLDQEIINNVFAGNLLRFLGLTEQKVVHNSPRQGE